MADDQRKSLAKTPASTDRTGTSTTYPLTQAVESGMKQLRALQALPLVSPKTEVQIWGAALLLFLALSSTSGFTLVWFWRQSWPSLLLDAGVSAAMGMLMRIMRTNQARQERKRALKILEMQVKALVGDFRYSLEVEATHLQQIVEMVHAQVGSIKGVDPRNRMRILDVAPTELQIARRASDHLQKEWLGVEEMLKQNLTLPANRATLQRMLSSIRDRLQQICEQCPQLAMLMDLRTFLNAAPTALPQP